MLNRRDFMWGAATSVGAMTVMSSEMVKAAPEPTMSLNVIYPNHDGARFDTSYYRSTHIPLAMKVMNAASVILIEGVPMGSSAAPYAMIAHFQFASSEALTGCSRQSSDGRGPGRCRQVHRHQADDHARQVAVALFSSGHQGRHPFHGRAYALTAIFQLP